MSEAGDKSFDDLVQAVAQFAGLLRVVDGVATLPDGVALSKCHEAVNEGQRRLVSLFPRADWLSRELSITLRDGVDTYDLPYSWSDIVKRPWTYDEILGQQPVQFAPIATVEEARSRSGLTSGYPVKCATRRATKSNGRIGYVLILWPKPGSAETITTSYRATPGDMESGDMPIVPPHMVDALVASCIARAELIFHEKKDGPRHQDFLEAFAAAQGLENARVPRNRGYVGNPNRDESPRRRSAPHTGVSMVNDIPIDGFN